MYVLHAHTKSIGHDISVFIVRHLSSNDACSSFWFLLEL